MPRGVSRYDEAQLQRRLWTPEILGSGLKFWADTSDMPTLSLSSGGITSITGKPPTAATWTYGTTRPNWLVAGLNNRPSGQFQSNASAPRMTSGAVTLSLPMLWIWAGAMVSGAGSYARLFSFAAASGADSGAASACAVMLRNVGANGIGTYFNGSMRANTSVSLSTPLIFAVFFDTASPNSAISQYLNGTAGGTGTATAPTFGTAYVISNCYDAAGSTSSSDVQNGGFWGEGLVYCGGDAAARRHRLEGYLAHKWGIASNLAGTHPYKNAPPLIGA